MGFLTGHPRPTAHAKMNPHMNAAIPERRPATEEISGLIERVTFCYSRILGLR